MKWITFLGIFLLLFLISTPVSAYNVAIHCPEKIRIDDTLNCSISGNFPTGTTSELVLIRTAHNLTEIARQPIIIKENVTQFKSFPTSGLSAGIYKIDIEMADPMAGYLSPDSVITQQVEFLPENPQQEFDKILLTSSRLPFSLSPETTPAQIDNHETFFNWYWCRYEPVYVTIPVDILTVQQTMKVCYQFFWDGSYTMGHSAGLPITRIFNDKWKSYAEGQYSIRSQTFTYFGDRLESTLNPSFGPFKRDKTGVGDQRWGIHGTGQGQFSNPEGIALDGIGDVFIADTNNHRVQKFSPDGKFLTQWRDEPEKNESNYFKFPEGIAINPAGIVYILDADRIQKFDINGKYLGEWSINWTGSQSNYNRKALAADSSGFIYVTGDSRVQKFDSNGTLLTQWGSKGSGDGQFIVPWSIAVDSKGDVYVADFGNNRVQKFDSNGSYLTQWGSSGSNNGQFNGPAGIGIDTSDIVYVTDLNNKRIQAILYDGTYLTQFGWQPTWSGEKELYAPSIIAVNGNGFFYIIDGDSIRKISPTIPNATYMPSISPHPPFAITTEQGTWTHGNIVSALYDPEQKYISIKYKNFEDSPDTPVLNIDCNDSGNSFNLGIDVNNKKGLWEVSTWDIGINDVKDLSVCRVSMRNGTK